MLSKEKRITTNDATTARTIKKAVESLWFVVSNHPVSHHELTRAWDIEDHDCSYYCYGCHHFENTIRYGAQSNRRKSETEIIEHHRVRGCQHTQNEELYFAHFACSIYLVYLVYFVSFKGRNGYLNESLGHFHQIAAISFCFVPLCFEMREN